LAERSRYERAYIVNVDVVPNNLLMLSCVVSAGWEKSSDVPKTPAAAYSIPTRPVTLLSCKSTALRAAAAADTDLEAASGSSRTTSFTSKTESPAARATD
jgi:hypothetical protein